MICQMIVREIVLFVIVRRMLLEDDRKPGLVIVKHLLLNVLFVGKLLEKKRIIGYFGSLVLVVYVGDVY